MRDRSYQDPESEQQLEEPDLPRSNDEPSRGYPDRRPAPEPRHLDQEGEGPGDALLECAPVLLALTVRGCPST